MFEKIINWLWPLTLRTEGEAEKSLTFGEEFREFVEVTNTSVKPITITDFSAVLESDDWLNLPPGIKWSVAVGFDKLVIERVLSETTAKFKKGIVVGESHRGKCHFSNIDAGAAPMTLQPQQTRRLTFVARPQFPMERRSESIHYTLKLYAFYSGKVARAKYKRTWEPEEKALKTEVGDSPNGSERPNKSPISSDSGKSEEERV